MDFQHDWGFDDAESLARFHEAWESVEIVRRARYGLFTFGESVLPYYLLSEPEAGQSTVSVARGEVRIERPMIITPDNAPPEISNFLDDHDEEMEISHLLSRTANFRHLRFNNEKASPELVSDRLSEVVERIERRLDVEEDDHTAILTAPAGLGGAAVLRYAIEQVIESAPDNVQELRERGFLP